MQRPVTSGRAAALVLLAALAGTACNSTTTSKASTTTGSTATPSTATPSTDTPNPSASRSAAVAPLSSRGISLYLIGASQASLQAEGKLRDVATTSGCPGWATAKGTAGYAQVDLAFYQDKLIEVTISSTPYRTSSGAQVGQSLSHVKGLYGPGTLLSDGLGGKAYSVHGANGLGILFYLDKAGTTVTSFVAGHIQALEMKFTDGEGC